MGHLYIFRLYFILTFTFIFIVDFKSTLTLTSFEGMDIGGKEANNTNLKEMLSAVNEDDDETYPADSDGRTGTVFQSLH